LSHLKVFGEYLVERKTRERPAWVYDEDRGEERGPSMKKGFPRGRKKKGQKMGLAGQLTGGRREKKIDHFFVLR